MHTFIVLLIIITTTIVTSTSDFWAGIDTVASLSPPIGIVNVDGLDSPTRTYPAIESHGSLYMPSGNIILSDGDMYIAGTSVAAMSVYLTAVAEKICNVVCGPVMTVNVSSCTCICKPGFASPPLCLNMYCYNGGTWSPVNAACTCRPPYTSSSFCRNMDCGQNAVIDPTTTNKCVCIFPYTGTQCNTTTADILQYPADECFDRLSTACGTKNNYGVASCDPVSGVCTCPPLYPRGTGAVYLRAMTCPSFDTTCLSAFAVLADACCAVATSVCEHPPPTTTRFCQDELCCQSISTPVFCLLSNCQWSSSDTVCTIVSQTAYPTWSLRVTTCSTPPQPQQHSLCSTDVAYQQQQIFQQQSLSPPLQIIQSRAWRYISTFAIWDDGLTHSIVTSSSSSSSSSPSRLAALFNGPYWSSLVWSTSYTANPKHTTQFTFELVEDTTAVDPASIGSVYRIWISSFCLVSRPLQQDELAQIAATATNIPAQALIMWNVATPYADLSISDCGLFTITDSTVSPYNTPWSISPTSATYTSSSSPTPITTPSQIQDMYDFPTPLVSADMMSCRRATCLLDYIVGQCSSVACARAMFTDPSQWDLCRPCIAAHAFFSFAASSNAFQ